MEAFHMEVREGIAHLVHLAVAYGLALPIAWDRERSERSFGMRTFPLVAVASCKLHAARPEPARGLSRRPGAGDAGRITGVSFLGAGIIMKQNRTVRGMATAAAIWTTTAMGAAVAQDDYGIAVAVSLVTFVTLRWLDSFKLLLEEPNEPPRP